MANGSNILHSFTSWTDETGSKKENLHRPEEEEEPRTSLLETSWQLGTKNSGKNQEQLTCSVKIVHMETNFFFM